MSNSILDVVEHYQRSIERCQEDETRLLHCISKLYKLPVKVEHLQETGIGKTVNSLRKFNGEIGVAAKALVTKWKAMVAAEEEPIETNCQSNEDDTNNANGRRHGSESSDDDQYDNNRNSSTQSKAEPPQHEQKSTESTKEREKHKHSSSKEGGESSRHLSGSTHHSEKPSGSTQESSSRHKSSSSRSHSEKRESEKHKSREKAREKPDHKDKERERREHSEKRRDEKHGHEHGHGEEKKTSSSSQRKSNGGSNAKRRHPEDDDEKQHSTKEKTELAKEHEKIKKSKQRESEKHNTSKEKDRHESRKSKDDKHQKEKSSDKKKEADDKHKSSHTSSSSSKPSTLVAAANSEPKKRRHNSCENASGDESKSPAQAKVAKVQKVTKSNDADGNEHDDDGIDSTMGANFADVLGMLNMPAKKSKKSLNAGSSTSSGAKSSISKESPNKSHSSSKLNGMKSYLTSSPKASTSSSASTTRPSPDVKPDLLSSTAKLEPLDPSIALELPTISNNYRPLPRNQTVMDCIYNTSLSSSSKAPSLRTLTDAEAISHGISSKTMRTKIYSGVKTGQILQVPSLFDLCIRVLQKNIDALEYTGGVPFEVLRPVLERATPQQLLIFEEYNPYLMEDSDVLWQLHAQRNYRAHKRQEMESWREMFLRCQEDQERKLSILAESIKQSQKIIAAPVRKTQLAFVDSMVKPPRNVQRKQEQYGTKEKLIATPAARVAALSSVTPNAAKMGDVRLRVAASVRDNAQVAAAPIRPRRAPLMAKTLQLMRGRHKR